MNVEQVSLFTDSAAQPPVQSEIRPALSPEDKGEAYGLERSASILRSAFEVFTDAGYAGARMDEIAARAGVAKGLIYFYYQNKEKLFEAVLKEYITKPVHNIIVASNPAESMARRLIRTLDMFYARMLAGPFFSRLARLVLIDGTRFPEAHRYFFSEVLAPVLALLGDCLKEGARRGEWREEDIPAHPQMLFAPAMLLTLWRMALNQYLNVDAKSYVREHQKYMLKALRLDDDALADAMAVAGELPPDGDPVSAHVGERGAASAAPSGHGRKRALRLSRTARREKNAIKRP